MPIVDDRAQWQADFEAGWLAHYQQTGEADWQRYNLPRNETTVSGKAVDLAHSRLAVITTGGFYVEGQQAPFDEPDKLGRYDLRLLPSDAAPESFAISHTHYDHAAANQDRQVLLPVGHLAQMVEAGEIGEIAPHIVSFMGYQPDVSRVIDETVPGVIEAARDMQADAAILIPA